MQANTTPIPELGGRTWEELEVLEAEDGHQLFQDQIRQRKRSGWEAIEVRVRVPRPGEKFEARAEARKLFTEHKLDPDRDSDVLAELEQVCMLARAIRTAKAPHSQFATYDELLREFDEVSLQDVLGRIKVYEALLDPRESKLTDEQIFEKVVAISRLGNLGPLVDIVGHEQPSCVVRMADLALSSPRVQSWLQSLESSIRAPSPQESSPGS